MKEYVYNCIYVWGASAHVWMFWCGHLYTHTCHAHVIILQNMLEQEDSWTVVTQMPTKRLKVTILNGFPRWEDFYYWVQMEVSALFAHKSFFKKWIFFLIRQNWSSYYYATWKSKVWPRLLLPWPYDNFSIFYSPVI